MTGTDRTTSPPTRPLRVVPLALGAVLAVAALTACGSDAPAEDTAATASSAAPATEESSAAADSAAESGATSVPVTSVDFGYELDRSAFRAGENTITLTNGGDATHDLVVERDGQEIAASDAIDPGQSTTLTVALEPGEYVFYCSIGNHRSMGMEVTVEVAA
jgi:plastocyanin